jgi:acetoin utilization deacetylase AcuC-like enzyme
MKIGLIKLVHEDLHPAPPGHPENSLRMSGALKVIESSDIAAEIDFLTPGDADIGALYNIHDRRYIDGVRDASEKGGGYLDSDTYVGRRSFAAAMKVVTAAVWAGDRIMDGAYNRIFLAGRPPGHHAERTQGMGFCIFNNVAVAAEHLIRNKGLSRVAIVDWDVHHGNGTQNAFYDRDDVLFISLHQSPFYPGTGRGDETGEGSGIGYTLNLPMAPGSGDNDYKEAFEENVIPALENFRPEMILISAGFDARSEDPLASINLSENAYSFMTSNLVDLAKRYCNGRILSFFEGGYDPRANAESLYAHLKELMRE